MEREYLHIVEREYLHIVEREYLYIVEREFLSFLRLRAQQNTKQVKFPWNSPLLQQVEPLAQTCKN